MVAMMAGLVLSLTAGAILVFGYTAWATNTNSVKMQNDGSLALLAIGREIRKSNIADITINDVEFNTNPNAKGDRIDFITNSVRHNPASVFIKKKKKLIIRPGDFAVVEGGLTQFKAKFNPDTSIDITLKLQGGTRGGKTTLQATFTPRN